ncbi:MAG TPA: hydroxymethylbilane synthase [Vicinamibacterales bacterium]
MIRLRIGTRGSQLALVQAREVEKLLIERAHVPCELVIISTSGDRMSERSLADAGGKRLFVKEIEDALLAGMIDVAVHSSKDLPVDLPGGLGIGAVLPREDPADAWVARHVGGGTPGGFDAATCDLPNGTRVGTGSVRRIAQLRPLLLQARFEPIRGNVDTRLRKLDRGEYDVIVLASAGLRRLNLADRVTAPIPPDVCVPAPGQGIIAIEIRSDDDGARRILAPLDDANAATALTTERALVTALGGGCQTPIGALCRTVNQNDTAIELLAVVASLDGAQLVRSQQRGSRAAPHELGQRVADKLLEQGAADILAEARAEGTSVADPHGP